MLAITSPSYGTPEKYELSTLPRPTIPAGTEGDKMVLIKVHAASVNPVDAKLASGMLKFAVKDTFPYRLGFDCSGVVVEVGKGVERVGVGEEVFVRLPEESRGEFLPSFSCFRSLCWVGGGMGLQRLGRVRGSDS
jgi:NADPH:quinone reductase-like Zn-dependent oxidoreductase